ncbi:MAG: carboxypeptidase-like regulatory domain-containing protein, partial [Armatimonadota bacterium]|nr:carboxypeptidase-like regulatory domain-containing protein [Armatimonadota bacterium]
MTRTRSALLAITLSLAPAHAATVTGKVVGPDEKPVADAHVLITGADAATKKILSLQTNPGGEFTAELQPSRSAPDYFGSVTVYAPGFALRRVALKQSGNLIRLERGGQVSGTVTDAAGQPISGARVKLVLLYAPFDASGKGGLAQHVPAPMAEQLAVTTGADGRWTFDGVPEMGNAVVELDDPRYVRTWAAVPVKPDGRAIPSLVAKPGATIAGKVIFEDGRPARGVEVFAEQQSERHWSDNSSWSRAITAEDGSYRLTGLTADTFNVMVIEPSGEWIAAAAEGVKTAAGQTSASTDLVLTRGAIVEGTVVDDTTQKPLAWVGITSHGPHYPRSSGGGFGSIAVQDKEGRHSAISSYRPSFNTSADDQGRYRLRVAPGEVFLRPQPPQAYLWPQAPEKIAVTPGETKQVVLRLSKGLTLTGIAVDPDGKPLAGATFSVNGLGARSDAEGKFSVSGLTPGPARIEAWSWEGWRVVAPMQVTLPLAGPLRVTLRKVQILTAQGRVRTPDGQPVSGTHIKARIGFHRGSPYSWRNAQATTDAEGRFTLTELQPESTIEFTIEKRGYRYVSGGQLTKQDGAFTITDIILAPLQAKIEGRVVDATGAPVAGARVMSLDGDLDVHVTTDDAGRFILGSLPEGEVEVLAAHGFRVGKARGRTDGPPLLVKLEAGDPPPSGDLGRGAAILEEVVKTSPQSRETAPLELVPYDVDLALKLARQPDGSVPDKVLQEIINRLAQSDPARAARWGPEHLNEIKDPLLRLQSAVALGLAVASTQPELAGSLLQSAREWVKPKDYSEENARAYFRLAALAQRLKAAQAESLFQMANAVAERATGEKTQMFHSLLSSYVAAVARFDPRLAEEVGRQLPSQYYAGALARAIRDTASSDPALARTLLDMLEKLAERAKLDGTDSKDGYLPSVSQVFGGAAKVVIRAIGPRDPAAALALARKVQQREHKAHALALAAKFQSADSAAQLFREATDLAAKESMPARTM